MNLKETSREAYKILGVSPECTTKELRTAFVALAKVHHPDAGGSAEAFRTINDAYLRVIAIRKEGSHPPRGEGRVVSYGLGKVRLRTSN